MIDFKTEKGNVYRAKFQGGVTECVADFALAIHIVYARLAKTDESKAVLFKRIMTLSLTNDEIANQIFSEDCDLTGSHKEDPEIDIEVKL